MVSQYVGGFDESFFCLATRLGRGDYPLSLELPALRLRGAWISQGIISIDHKQQVKTASLRAVDLLTPRTVS